MNNYVLKYSIKLVFYNKFDIEIKQKSMKKAQITFETENDLHDEMKIIMDSLNSAIQSSPDLQPYVYKLKKMMDLYEDTYTKNVRLLENIQDMNSQILLIASKIQTIHKSTNTDKDSLKKLKDDFDEASRMVFFANQSEKKSKEILATLRQTVESLSSRIMSSQTFTMGEDTSAFEVQNDVENLTKEKHKAETDIKELTNQIEEKAISLETLTAHKKSLAIQLDRVEKLLNERDAQNTNIKSEVDEIQTSINEIKPQIPIMQKQIASNSKSKVEKARCVEDMKLNLSKILSGLGTMNDLIRKKKAHQSRRARQHAELQKTIISRSARIELNKEHIVTRENELVGLNATLENIQKQNKEYQTQNDELQVKCNELTEMKNIIRKQAKDLSIQIVPLTYQIAQTDNMLSLDQRSIIGANIAITKEESLHGEEKRATNEIKVAKKAAKANVRTEKFALQQLKESFITSITEIDKIRTEKVRILNLYATQKEKNKIIKEENEVQLKELHILNSKIADQTVLSEQLRDERNTAKRRFEELDAENQELRLQVYGNESDIYELQQNYLNMLSDTAKDHLSLRGVQEDIDGINNQISETQKMIKTTERIISRLAAESQTLFHILQDSTHDRLQQKKELQLLVKNKEIVQEQTLKKEHQLKELREKITVDLQFMKKSSQLFRKSIEDSVKMLDELEKYRQQTKELEKKCEKVKALQLDMHTIMANTIIEKQKCAALVHEFEVPRNIHRWDLLSAVDPELVKELKYRTEISAKIDAAHRQHLELLATKNKLEQELAEQKKILEQSPSKAKVLNDMQQYRDDIRRMDNEIAEIEQKIQESRKEITEKSSSVSTVRSKVAERKEKTLSLRESINSIKASEMLPPWFLTEVPLSKPNIQGGGFSMNPNYANSSYAELYPPKPLSNLPSPASKYQGGQNRRSTPQSALFIGQSGPRNRIQSRSSLQNVSPIYYVQPKTDKQMYSGFGWTRTLPSMS